jgi:hypothetical protein
MPSAKQIFWRGFGEITEKQTLFDEIQQGHDEGLCGSTPGTTSHGPNGDDKHPARGTAPASSKNLSE